MLTFTTGKTVPALLPPSDNQVFVHVPNELSIETITCWYWGEDPKISFDITYAYLRCTFSDFINVGSDHRGYGYHLDVFFGLQLVIDDPVV